MKKIIDIKNTRANQFIPAWLRTLLVYLFVFYFSVIVSFIFLKRYYQNNYTDEKLMAFIQTPSKYNGVTGDPCLYAVYGDPVTDNYVRINLYCLGNKSSLNTLALEAFKNHSTLGIINELARINGFEVKSKDKGLVSLGDLSGNPYWQCDVNDAPLLDLTQEITNQSTINCYPNKDIASKYRRKDETN